MNLRCFAIAVCGGFFSSSLAASAATMPAIQGHVLNNVRQQAVPSLPVQLYMDDGNQQFDAGDSMATSTVTDASGRYEFGGLNPDAAYFVVAADQVSVLQSPGAIDYVIDSFDITQSVVSDPISGARMDTVSGPAQMILGGHRDMYMQVLGGIADAKLRANPYSIDSSLEIAFAAGVTGLAAVTWDGIGGSRGMIPDAGLGGVDLTLGGLYEGIMLRLAVDAAGEGQMLQLVLQTDGGNSSVAEVEFPVVPKVKPTAVAFLPFDSFVGTADATNVSAIQLIVNSTKPSLDARISMLGMTGPTEVDFNIVPEPSGALLALAGLALLTSRRGRRARTLLTK